MATVSQRAISILEAGLNRVSTATERQRVLDAFGDAASYIAAVRGMTIARVKDRELASTMASAGTQITTDFAETP